MTKAAATPVVTEAPLDLKHEAVMDINNRQLVAMLGISSQLASFHASVTKLVNQQNCQPFDQKAQSSPIEDDLEDGISYERLITHQDMLFDEIESEIEKHSDLIQPLLRSGVEIAFGVIDNNGMKLTDLHGVHLNPIKNGTEYALLNNWSEYINE